MDRDGIARRLRRAEALEALEFEREREVSLRTQMEQIILEAEGPRIDGEAYDRLEPADAALVRSALGAESDADADEDGDEDWETWDDAEPDVDDEDETESEIARLDEEIAGTRRRQLALERFIDALSA